MPVSELKKTLPSTIAGCWYIDEAPGIPKAHFSFSLETWPVVSPAALPGWKRVFALSTPQPFQDGAAAASFTGAGLAQRFGMDFASPDSVAPSRRADTHSAMERLSLSES